MGTYTKRHNEKARSGMLAKNAALKKARQKQFHRQPEEQPAKEEEIKPAKERDPNAEMLHPLTEEEKLERKRKIQELVQPQKETKMSRAKKKRLDKYIEHQLKREEKQVLISKLQDSKFDTSLLKPSKLLGRGKQTQKEEFEEALSLEKQGRADERTKEILYEERTVKDWDENENQYSDGFDDDSGSDGGEEEEKKSSFVDFRPTKLGGMGSGFAFSNIKKVKRSKPKAYNWKEKLLAEERRKNKIEDEQDFVSSESEEEDEEEDEEEEEEEVEENEDEGDEDGQDEVEEEDEDEDEDEDDSEMEFEEQIHEERPKFTLSSKAEAFKEWADEQLKKLEGREAETLPTLLPQREYQRIERPEDKEDDLHEDYVPINESLNRKATYVTVNRPQEIQDIRLQLPVVAEEHRIMEAIHHNDVVIICGETGSGKTTQVPQFLYESGYGSSEDTPGLIGITQPRRVAAVSMSERVSNELGNHGDRVAYQIRFDSTTKPTTKLKFMTDGVLLREMMTDFLLEKYSAIVIDEAHERNINTDILIGMLSRVVRLRSQLNKSDPKKYKVLKLIIMSATLRVSDFSENPTLFSTPPPILKVEARQYPVSVHFNKKTPFNYMDEAFRKTCKIHKKLPPGGILIFLTGQNEIQTLVKKLKNEFPFPQKKKRQTVSYKRDDKEEDNSDELTIKVDSKKTDVEAEDIDFTIGNNENTDDYDEGEEDEENEEGFDEVLEEGQTDKDPLFVLPLYSLLPTKEQMKVFQDPPPGSRICIVATNVAETSLTIPGIRYVVDCGRSKERKYDSKTGVQSFEIDWISKASADQRSGRAGRTGPGHCYRIYSSAIYERAFPQFSVPEILRMPIESIVLQMKSMGIDNVINFPFPTPPERIALKNAETLLKNLGALSISNGTITELGRTISFFPLSPRFAKMLIVGNQHDCLPYIVAIVSALSVGDPFITESELGLVQQKQKQPANGNAEDDDDSDVEKKVDEEEFDDPAETERKRKLLTKFNNSKSIFNKLDKYSDVLRLLSAVCAYDHVPQDKKSTFLKNQFLRGKVMEETFKLRKQLMYIVKSITTKENISNEVTAKEMKLGVPSKLQVKLIKQMVSTGFVDQIAIRADLIDPDIKITDHTNIINIPYKTLLPISDDGSTEFVYIHPSSILCNIGEIPPNYLVYQSIFTSSNKNNIASTTAPKARMRSLVDITPKALGNVAKTSELITYSKPLGYPYAPKLINSSKRTCYVVPRIGAAVGSGGVGWDLPPIQVTQNRINGQWENEL